MRSPTNAATSTDRRGRPRQRPVGVGQSRPERGDRARLLRCAGGIGARSMRPDHPCHADGAEWIADVVSNRCPNAIRCADPFHVVGWATEALDAVRRDAWNNARRAGHTRNHGWAHGRRATVATGPALALRRARYALWKNPEKPHRPPTGEAGVDRQDRLDAVQSTGAPKLWPMVLLRQRRAPIRLPTARAVGRASPGRYRCCPLRVDVHGGGVRVQGPSDQEGCPGASRSHFAPPFWGYRTDDGDGIDHERTSEQGGMTR
jgi:hypothetical protein